MNEFEKFEQDLKEAAKRNYGPLKNSKIFISIFSKGMIEEPLPVLQLGMAILMGKPIALIAKEGDEIPETLKRMSFCVETYKDSKDVERVGRNVVKIAKEKGYM